MKPRRWLRAFAGQWDPKVDALYFPFREDIPDGTVTGNITIEDPRVAGMIVLDLDKHGQLVGLEVIGARDVIGKKQLKALAEGPINE